ncbi:DDX54 [Cordylochernes scorpioides]|uniref:RNA helicase n=1 Tax=Cordylochernes scorpioides TaxID=51811 RepID=A0ABY6JUS8_9ARAC|nr:DDX54 [Cordylochernes scorpioides]
MEEKNPQNEDEFFKQLNEAAGSLKKKKSGGFQSMGLSLPVLRGILCRGYKVPTPIQRKCLCTCIYSNFLHPTVALWFQVIPVLLEGHDVVAMARTGSGKTAAFLVPMFERLKTHSTTGVRALILSPTRELAEQTHSFIKQLGYKTGLKSALIIGGRSMSKNFLSIHSNPDILVATLGRLIHVLMEMSMSLNSVEYLVLDEADR